MNFTEIPSLLKYPKDSRGKLETLHSKVVVAFSNNCSHVLSAKRQIIHVMNIISHLVLTGDAFPEAWDSSHPLDNIDLGNYPDAFDLRDELGSLYIDLKDVEWDIEDSSDSSVTVQQTEQKQGIQMTTTHGTSVSIIDKVQIDTPKEDLWLRVREIPRFDYSNPWWYDVKQDSNGRNVPYIIPKSLPLIPERQRDITITTDVNTMTDYDIDKLFPNHFIRTRQPCMYEPLDGVELHPDFGLILSIDGFTREQIIDNIIKYPHLHIIRRLVDDKVKEFFKNIEISGELHSIDDVWETLPDTKNLPKTKEFAKEYVIRRYLLERDIKGIAHKYPMLCDFMPYLTLFMPKEMYLKHGYSGVGRLHVQSRVKYLQSMNPMLKSLLYNTSYRRCVQACPFCDQCTETECDMACPRHVAFMHQFSTINKYDLKSKVFQASETLINQAKKILEVDANLVVAEVKQTSESSDLITYIACCQAWKSAGINCAVHHINFSQYLDLLKRSYSVQMDDFEQMKIWMDYANTLIISGLDYVQFLNRESEFQTATLITILNNRKIMGKKTIIVSPKIDSLIGKGLLFDKLKELLREAVIR